MTGTVELLGGQLVGSWFDPESQSQLPKMTGQWPLATDKSQIRDLPMIPSPWPLNLWVEVSEVFSIYSSRLRLRVSYRLRTYRVFCALHLLGTINGLVIVNFRVN